MKAHAPPANSLSAYPACLRWSSPPLPCFPDVRPHWRHCLTWDQSGALTRCCRRIPAQQALKRPLGHRRRFWSPQPHGSTKRRLWMLYGPPPRWKTQDHRQRNGLARSRPMRCGQLKSHQLMRSGLPRPSNAHCQHCPHCPRCRNCRPRFREFRRRSRARDLATRYRLPGCRVLRSRANAKTTNRCRYWWSVPCRRTSIRLPASRCGPASRRTGICGGQTSRSASGAVAWAAVWTAANSRHCPEARTDRRRRNRAGAVPCR